MIPYRTFSSLLLAVLIVFVFSTFLAAEQTPAPVSYHLKVLIDPPLGRITVRGTVDAPVSQPSPSLRFALHETFSIKQLLINGKKASFSFQTGKFTPLNPASHDVLVSLPSDVPQGRIRMSIEYEGKLKELPEFGADPKHPMGMDDQVNSRMVELANYSSWYPQIGVYGAPIHVELEVSLPQGWISICSGRKLEEHVSDGRSVSRWSSPNDTDILITASPNYKKKSVPLAGGDLEIYYTQLPDEFVTDELGQVAAVMKLFTDRLGETTIPAGTVKQVYSPKGYGQGRAGIARPGMIVTSEGRTLDALAKDRNFSLLQDVAHEIAHFWWNFGAAQGDWINEAFAEYFSAIAVQEVVSEAQFERVLKNYQRQVGDLSPDAPSLSHVPFDGSGFVIRYYKGSLMLDSVRQTLGDKKFFQASHDFFQQHQGKPTGTAEFRSFWKERLGEQKDSLDLWLDSPGRVPTTDAAGR